MRTSGRLLLAALLTAASLPAAAQSSAQRLLDAYPQHLDRIDGNELVWRDGSRMVIDDGKGAKSPAQRLDDPDIDDMFAEPYPAGLWPAKPGANTDPGRARNWAFFSRMYGDCSKGRVERHLEDVSWLAGTHQAQRVRVTRINGVADRLRQVSAELVRLPAQYRPYLSPAAGGYNCRPIAGTGRVSPHGLGIAFDLSTQFSDYWRWTGTGVGQGGAQPWRNRIPREIVDVFERHGFIWGGRWSAFDTMHFEYRPELLPAPLPGR